MPAKRKVLLALALASVPALVLSARQSPASAGPAAASLIEDLIAANRILAEEGIVDAFGHVSVRHDRDPNRYLLARSLAPALVTADDLIEYDLESNAVNARGRAQYSERYIHGEIYKARPDVRAIVHAHPMSLVPFGVSTVPLRPVYHMAGFIGDGLPIYDIRDASGMTDMLVRDAARGQAMARSLGGKPAVLMRGHGVAVVGPGLPFAVGRSIYLDLNARIQLQALGLGAPVRYLDAAEAQEILKSGENTSYQRPWEFWKRRATGR